MNVFHGTVIHSLAPGALTVHENALLVVGPDGVIQHLQPDVAASAVPERVKALGGGGGSGPDDAPPTIRYLQRTQFLIPGFVDTHNHAPQWAMRGLGQSMHILDWLDQVTFPQEARFEDAAYARRIYARCVDGFLRQGVTTAAYYGSRHGEATRILADLCLARGQRALVGKCNMDRQAPDYYRDADAAASLAETAACLAHVRSIDPTGALVRYVVTPRFAITCGPELLAGLGEIVRENPGLAVQTHFNEAEQEMRFTRELFPQFDNEVDLYEHYGLLTRDAILAHCCYMTEYEMQRFQELDCGVAHCPTSNMTVGGGFMAAPIRAFLDRGIKVGLGTDSGGGFSSSMLDSIRHALIASNAREAQTGGAAKCLHPHEAFYLATLGGARVCGLADKVGSLEVGKEFDALVVDADPPADAGGVMTLVEDADDATRIFDKFLMTGDDRNIEQVYVRGRRVKG